MSDVTQILGQIENGDPSAAEKLFPLVYEELRKLAEARMTHEKPGQTLQATAPVHEVYVTGVSIVPMIAGQKRHDNSTTNSYNSIYENQLHTH